MAHLVKKKIKGHIYWYAVRTAWVNGRSKVVSQVYLGTAERLERLVKDGQSHPPKIKNSIYPNPSPPLGVGSRLAGKRSLFLNLHKNKW